MTSLKVHSGAIRCYCDGSLHFVAEYRKPKTMKSKGIAIWLLSLLSFGTISAQDQDAASKQPAAQPAVTTQQALKSAQLAPRAYLDPNDVDFAHIAVGDVWRTTFFIINMTANTIPYTISYFDPSGNPMLVPVLTTGGTYNGNLGQLGGFSVFQEITPGQPTYEATVALSGSDWKIYLPYYHFNGYTSGVAIANPTGLSGTTVTITALDNLGNSLFQDSIYLPPYGQYSFSVTARYPSLINQRGNLYIESSSGRLSAIGLRFAPGGSYTTIPIMNWPGMF